MYSESNATEMNETANNNNRLDSPTAVPSSPEDPNCDPAAMSFEPIKTSNNTYSSGEDRSHENDGLSQTELNDKYFYAPCDGWPKINMMSFQPPAQGTTCWLCQGAATSTNDPSFFYPCNCGAVHRLCFHEWRQGWITPKNYFSCPTCMHSYTIERADKNFDPASQEESEIRSAVRWRLALFWVILFTVLIASVCLLATIAWAADRETKDIPIGISYVLTSVARGVPDSNTTQLWREDFIDPDTPTWPYYGTFGILATSIIIIVVFIINTIYEQCCESIKEQQRTAYRDTESQKCSQQCHCHSSDCNSCCLFCYCPHSCSSSGGGRDESCCRPGTPQFVNRQCSDCCTDALCCHCDGFDCARHVLECECAAIDCGACGDCCSSAGDCCKSSCSECAGCVKCDFGGCGDGAIPVLCVVALVIAVAVVVSAVFIVAYFAGQRLERYHAWVSKMLYNRQLELNNKMVVIGKGESLRPVNAD